MRADKVKVAHENDFRIGRLRDARLVAIIDDHATRRRVLPFKCRPIGPGGGHCGDAGSSHRRLAVSLAGPCHVD